MENALYMRWIVANKMNIPSGAIINSPNLVDEELKEAAGKFYEKLLEDNFWDLLA